jgi:hypothetical protein
LGVQRMMLRKGEGSAYHEVGTLVDERPGEWVVRTADGDTRAFPRAGHMLVVRGGVFHILRVYPEQMPKIFEAHPEAVVEQLLRESREPLLATAIKRKLQDLSLRADAVDATWPRIKGHLDKSSSVEVSKSKPPRYGWRGAHPSNGLLHLLPMEPRSGTTAAGQLRDPDPPGAQADPSAAREEGRSVQSSSAEESPTEAETPAPSTPAQVTPAEAPPSAGEPPSHSQVASLVRRLGGPADVADAEAVARRLLECGKGLATASEDDLQALFEVPQPERSTAVALLATLPKKSRILDGSRSPLDNQAAAAFVELVIGEVGRAEPKLRRELAAPALAFVDRLLMPQEPAGLPVHLLARLVIALATQVPGATVRLRDRATALIAESLRKSPAADTDVWFASDVRALARATQDLPLEKRSGRSLFLAALYNASPGVAQDPMWWADVSMKELAQASTGPLAVALNDETIGRTFVAPVVRSFVDSASTRGALAQVVGAPVELARHLSDEMLRQLWDRAASTDNLADQWLSALSSEAELEHLRHSTDKATANFERSNAKLASSIEKIRGLEAELDRLHQELRAMRQETHVASEAHDRQVKLDVVTALANLALSVVHSPEARNDAALMQTVDYITGREGLDKLEAAGAEVTFRPDIHDSMGETISPETPVTVLRPGYTYMTAAETIVLIKAQVGKLGR